MSSPISSNTPSSIQSRAVRQARGDEPSVVANEQPAQEEAAGVQVSFSDAMRERLGAMRKSIGTLSAQSQQAAETRKQQARERIEQLRQRIKQLKMLVASLGAMAPKGLLREIAQLARELGQAAAVLKEGGGTASSSSGSVSAASVTTEMPADMGADAGDAGDAGVGAVAEAATVAPVAVSESEVASDESEGKSGAGSEDVAVTDAATSSPASADEKADKPLDERDSTRSLQVGNADSDQKRADAELIRKAVSELKALLALARASQTRDEESDKQIKEIEKQLRDCEAVAAELGGAGGISVMV
ncbi:hypothetical protein [Pseudomonas sp. Marseille-Q8238]